MNQMGIMQDQDERYKAMLEDASMKLKAENEKLRADMEALKDDKALLTGQLQQSRKHVKEVDLEINAMKPVVEAAQKYLEVPPPYDQGTWEALQKAVEKYQGKKRKCECIPGVHKNCPQHGYPPLRPLEGPGSVDE